MVASTILGGIDLRNLQRDLGNLDGKEEKFPYNEELTGHKNIRKLNVRNYIIYYTVEEESSKAFVVRIGHAFMDWEKYLKDE